MHSRFKGDHVQKCPIEEHKSRWKLVEILLKHRDSLRFSNGHLAFRSDGTPYRANRWLSQLHSSVSKHQILHYHSKRVPSHESDTTACGWVSSQINSQQCQLHLLQHSYSTSARNCRTTQNQTLRNKNKDLANDHSNVPETICRHQ